LANFFLENFILLTVFSCYFIPGIQLGLLQIRIDDFFILVVLPLIFLYKPRIYRNPIIISLFVISFFMIISLIYGYIFLGVSKSVRDFNELVRLSKPLIFSIFISRCQAKYLIQKVDLIMPFLSLGLIILGFIQFFNIAGLGSLIGSLYAPQHHIEAMIGHSKRIVLVGSNPNVAAAIAMLFFLYNFFRALLYREKVSYLYTVLLLIIILMTSSRTAILALGTIFFVFLLSSKSVKKLKKIFLITILIIIFLSLYNKFKYIAYGFELALKGENTSLIKRFYNWNEALNYFSKSPYLGWGFAKGNMTTIVDGEYFLLLRRFGLIGFLVIIITIFFMPFWGDKMYNLTKDFLIWSSVLKYYTIVVFYVMITNTFFSGYQLFIPYIFFSIIIYNLRRYND